MTQYILYLNLPDSYCQIFLPTENNRKYELELSAQLPVPPCKMELELLDGHWWMLRNAQIYFSADGKGPDSMQLSDQTPVYGLLGAEREKFSAWIRETSARELQFEKFSIHGLTRVVVGKAEQADIRLDSPYISHTHFILTKNRAGWVIEDMSRNGVYLDNQRIPPKKSLQLRPFSHIYTGGFHLIFLGELLAINCADQITTALLRYAPPAREDKPLPHAHEAFLRSPRFFEPLPQDVIDIEAPPQKQNRKKQPMLFVLGPALTMPLPMLATMVLRMGVGNGMGSYWIMGVSVVMSALIGLGWSLARRKYDAKEETAEESERQSAYRCYLQKNEALLQQRQAICRERLLRQYPSTPELVQKLTGGQAAEVLWNRNARAEDFTTVRLGLGRMDISSMIRTPAVRFSIRSDELEEQPAKLKEDYQTILQIPSLLCIGQHKLTGIIGEQARVQEVVRNIVLQLAMLHSYTDVRLIGLFREGEQELFSWLRWLPHVFSPDKSHRLLACSEADYQAVLSYLLDVLRARDSRDALQSGEAPLPVYVVLCTDPKILYNHAVYRYLTDGGSYNVFFLLAYGHMEFLPNECKYLVQADGRFSGAFRIDAEPQRNGSCVV